MSHDGTGMAHLGSAPFPPTPQVPGYELDAVLGSGASSVVWSARSRSGTRRAVKITAAIRPDGRSALAGALRERQVLRRIRSEHVVRVHEVHELPDGSVALVLDLASGGSLADLVRRWGPLAVGEVVTAVAPVVGTLALLHDAGVVHGDLSPANILFSGVGKPLLADYEAARVAGEVPSATSGTPGFVAPEVAAGSEPSPASDVFGAAAVAWFALTGAPLPDMAADDLATAVAEEVCGPLTPILRRMLAPDPGQRPTAAAAAHAMFEAEVPLPLRLSGSVDAGTAITRRIRLTATGSEPGAPRSRRARRAAAKRTARRAALRRWSRPSEWRNRCRRLPSGARIGVPGLVLAVGCAAIVGVVHPAPAAPAGPAAASSGAAPGSASPASPAVAAATDSPSRSPTSVATNQPAGDVGPVDVPPGTTPPTPVATGAATPTPGATAAAPGPPGPIVPSGNGATSPSAGGPAVDPKSDPVRALQQVVDARAVALAGRDRASLAAADSTGTPAWAHDEALIAQLTSSGRTYRDLRFRVHEARYRAGNDREATVDAVVGRAAYGLVDADGRTELVAEERGETWRYRLVRTEVGWRLADVTDPVEAAA